MVYSRQENVTLSVAVDPIFRDTREVAMDALVAIRSEAVTVVVTRWLAPVTVPLRVTTLPGKVPMF